MWQRTKPDGTDLVLDRDMAGAQRSRRPVAGPLEGLKPGKNKILVWKK